MTAMDSICCFWFSFCVLKTLGLVVIRPFCFCQHCRSFISFGKCRGCPPNPQPIISVELKEHAGSPCFASYNGTFVSVLPAFPPRYSLKFLLTYSTWRTLFTYRTTLTYVLSFLTSTLVGGHGIGISLSTLVVVVVWKDHNVHCQ